MKTFSPIKWFAIHILNPVMRRVAGKKGTPFALIRHVGRKSGKPYETPVILVRVDRAFVSALTYGSAVDWVRNILAAGRCEVVWHGTTYAITRIAPLDPAAGLSAYPQPFNAILRLRGTNEFLLLSE